MLLAYERAEVLFNGLDLPQEIERHVWTTWGKVPPRGAERQVENKPCARSSAITMSGRSHIVIP